MIMKRCKFLKNRNDKHLIRLLILMSLTFFQISCEKIFKEDEVNKLPLKTMDDYKQAMVGLYNRLSEGVMGNDLTFILSIGNEDDLRVDGYFESIPGCNINGNGCTYPLNANIFNTLDDCGGGSSSAAEDFSGPYKLFYQAIGGANDIISKAGDINKLSPEYKRIIGEVYFIRAYCYFRLVRMYGQIPLVANPDVDFTLPKPAFGEIYDFIANDLLKAMDLLPNSNNEARVKYETPNRGTAKAMLAEVYLTMGGYPANDNSKYAEAASVAGELIDSASYFGYGLVPDLADLWNGRKEKNPESEFSFYGNIASSKDGMNMYSDFVVAPDFYNAFPRNYRKESSFQTRTRLYNRFYDPVIQDYRYDSTLAHVDSMGYNSTISYKKFYSQFHIADSTLLYSVYKLFMGYIHDQTPYYNVRTPYTGHVVYVFRYAQTLLTYAEAKARSGLIDAKAYEAVNEVRRRANKVDLYSPSKFDLQAGLTPQQFADSVVQERAWELCAEPEGRWFDMLRLGLAANLVQIKRHQNIIVYITGIDKTTFFLPIPEEDKAINPNLK